MKYCIYCMKEKDEKEDVCPHCGKKQSEYTADQHILRPGTVLDHRYTVGAVIGEGGFGITYIGYDDRLGCRVAIKELYPNAMVNRSISLSNDVNSIMSEEALFNKCRVNFHNEAVILARYDSEPGIVSVKDCFSENKTEYIVMEYLDGITLMEYLRRVKRISYDNLLCLMFPVMQSLKKLHAEGIIHRDISPDNIMLVGETVKLIDFGAAREYLSNKTMSMVIKHGYAPMEQYNSTPGKQGEWTDVYSICATMYRCLVGKVPPTATDRIPEDSIELPSDNGINIASEYEAAVMHGMAVMPSGRIKNIDELMNKLKYGDPEYAAEMKMRSSLEDERRRKSEYITMPIPKDKVKEPVPNKEQDDPDNNGNDTDEHGGDNGVRDTRRLKLISAVCAGVLIVGGGIFAAVRMSGMEPAPAAAESAVSAVTENKSTSAAAVTAVSATASLTTTAPQTTKTPETTAPEVTTAEKHEPVTVKLDKKSVSMYVGDSEKLSFKLSAEGADVTWQSSDNTVVSVNNGTITAESGGTASVTVTTADGEKASCNVEVRVPSVELSSKHEDLFFGDSIYLYYDTQPGERDVIFSSSDPGIVRADGNMITALGKAGTATVTASMIYGDKTYTDSMVVTVSSIGINLKNTYVEKNKEALSINYDRSTGNVDVDCGYPGWTLDGAVNSDIDWQIISGTGYMDGAVLHITQPGTVRVRGTIDRNGYTATAEYTAELKLYWNAYPKSGNDAILLSSPNGSQIGTIPLGTYLEFTEVRTATIDGQLKICGRTSYGGQGGWVAFGMFV